MGEEVDAVPCPAGTRRDDDELGPVLAHVLRGEPGAREHLDVAELVELDGAPVEDASPLAETGKARDPAHDSADLGLRVDEMDAAEAALAEDDRALHPRRARADDEHVAVAVVCRLEALRVPAAAVLLARRRVLGAADVVALLGLHDANVAADALAHLAVAAFLDLPREEGVGDRRTGAPIRSQAPERMISAMRSGLVSRPTPTIGFAVASRTRPVHSSW